MNRSSLYFNADALILPAQHGPVALDWNNNPPVSVLFVKSFAHQSQTTERPGLIVMTSKPSGGFSNFVILKMKLTDRRSY